MSPQIVEKSNFHVKETLFLISLGKITVFHMSPHLVIFPAFLNIGALYKHGTLGWGKKEKEKKKTRLCVYQGTNMLLEQVFGVECTVRSKEEHG